MNNKTVKAERLIERLYKEAKLISPSHFQQWAMDEAKKIIDFDSGIWGDGVSTGKIYSLFLYNQPQEMVDNYSKLLKSGLTDDLSEHITQNPSKAISQLDFYSDWRNTEWYHRHCKQFGMEHACAISFFKQTSQLFSSIAYYRENPLYPFSPEDKQLKELIDPHLRESYELCLLFNLYKETNGSANKWEKQSIALADNEGYIYYCNDNFISNVEALDITQNAIIHPPLWEKLKQSRQLTVSHIDISLTAINSNQYLISLKPTDYSRQLTQTELVIARDLANGNSYKEIARKHNKSVSTVKNQAHAIYKKLPITGKEELTLYLEKEKLN